jgi:3D (Asp-Asp-Asp) domain-containing protein
MRRLAIALLLALAGYVFLAGPALRTSHAWTAPRDMHPVARSINFLIEAPAPDHLGDEKQLWATWYNMPRLYAAKATKATAPLIGRDGEAVSPALTKTDWCDAAMQGSVWVVDENGAAQPYVFIDAKGPEQVNCDAHFGKLSTGIKTATRRARFAPFNHPLGCDVRPQPLLAWRTIATDPKVIPRGTVLYVPDLRGRPFWMGGEHYVHDGYLVADDRGGAIKGRHIDFFVGEHMDAPFPDLITGSSGSTFAAFPVAEDAPAARAIAGAKRELCREIPMREQLRRPWRRPITADV